MILIDWNTSLYASPIHINRHPRSLDIRLPYYEMIEWRKPVDVHH
jgi:hypothetical protein